MTLEEACELFEPRVEPDQMRAIVRSLGVQPVGTRRLGRSGRPAKTYDAGELMKLHAALVPFLPVT